jgi:hypothetical protein
LEQHFKLSVVKTKPLQFLILLAHQCAMAYLVVISKKNRVTLQPAVLMPTQPSMLTLGKHMCMDFKQAMVQ